MTPLNGESCLLQVDPMIGAALISGGSSLLGGLFGSSASAKEGERQRKWASAENALNRQFQHDEAELSYNRNEQTRIAQNEWNSEPAQVNRMRQAGINPYNALSGLSGSSVTSAGNTASAGNAHGSSISYQQRNLDWIRAISETGLVAAQAYKTRAEANLINSENKGQDLQNAYDEVRNDFQNKYGDDFMRAELGLKRANWNLADSQASLNDALRHLSTYDLLAMKPVERANIIADTLVKDVLPSYYNSAAFKNSTDATLAGKMFGYQVAMALASINRDNAAARSLNSDVPLKSAMGFAYGKLGDMYDSQRLLNLAGIDESQSRTRLNNLNYDRGYISYLQEKDYNEKVWQFQMDAFKQSFIKQAAHDQMRNSAVVGKFTAGFFNVLDEMRGFVGFGFNQSSSVSQFSGHTTSQSSFKGSTTSFSENHNFNHKVY